jgi:hypothetical protein
MVSVTPKLTATEPHPSSRRALSACPVENRAQSRIPTAPAITIDLFFQKDMQNSALPLGKVCAIH